MWGTFPLPAEIQFLPSLAQEELHSPSTPKVTYTHRACSTQWIYVSLHRDNTEGSGQWAITHLFPPPALVTTDFPDGGASISRGSWCGDTADDGQLIYNMKKKIAVLLSLRFRGLFFFTNQTETARTNTACQGSTISPWVPQLEKPTFSYSHRKEKLNLCILIPQPGSLGIRRSSKRYFQEVVLPLVPESTALFPGSRVCWYSQGLSATTGFPTWPSGSGLQQVSKSPCLACNCSIQDRCKATELQLGRLVAGTWFCVTIFPDKPQGQV